MTFCWAVRTVRMTNGERFPVLVHSERGPLFEPTIFSLTTLRSKGRATATLTQALRAILVLYMWSELRGIDLQSRIADGKLLTLVEIDDLVAWCKMRMDVRKAGSSDEAKVNFPPKIFSLEAVRQNLEGIHHTAAPEIDAASASIRLHYIRTYIEWLSAERILKLAPSEPYRDALVASMKTVIGALRERMPTRERSADTDARQGLDPEELQVVDALIHPDSPNNPWPKCVRLRNWLIFQWLRALGIRRGELLGLRISDIDWRTNEVRVCRRADDPDDPRLNQPNAKTNGRLLYIGDNLAKATLFYVSKERKRTQLARLQKCDFLFVTTGPGNPLSLSGLNKIFSDLRKRCPGLPNSLTPHVFRHTWNDQFSREMDKNHVPEEQEKTMRSRLMGWSEHSKAATTYTRRHIREKARKASLELQQEMYSGRPPKSVDSDD